MARGQVPDLDLAVGAREHHGVVFIELGNPKIRAVALGVENGDELRGRFLGRQYRVMELDCVCMSGDEDLKRF